MKETEITSGGEIFIGIEDKGAVVGHCDSENPLVRSSS